MSLYCSSSMSQFVLVCHILASVSVSGLTNFSLCPGLLWSLSLSVEASVPVCLSSSLSMSQSVLVCVSS